MSLSAIYSVQPNTAFRVSASPDGLLHRIGFYHEGPLSDLSVYATDLAKLAELRDALTAYIEGAISGPEVSRAISCADESDLEIILAERSMPQWPVA